MGGAFVPRVSFFFPFVHEEGPLETHDNLESWFAVGAPRYNLGWGVEHLSRISANCMHAHREGEPPRQRACPCGDLPLSLALQRRLCDDLPCTEDCYLV